jgi:hypothetical protein
MPVKLLSQHRDIMKKTKPANNPNSAALLPETACTANMSGTKPINANEEYPKPGKLKANRTPEPILPRTGRRAD